MHWNDGMHNGGGSGWWLFMALMMLAFGQTAQTVFCDNDSAIHDQAKVKRTHAH